MQSKNPRVRGSLNKGLDPPRACSHAPLAREDMSLASISPDSVG